jgi:hypothetical protein
MPIIGIVASSIQPNAGKGITYISTTTVSGSSTSTVSLSGFSGYDDLMIVYSGRNVGASNADNQMTVNNNGASIYSGKILFASGSANGEAAFGSPNIYRAGYIPYPDMTANYYGNSMIYLHDYANTTSYKTIRWQAVSPVNTSVGFLIMGEAVASVASTAAITSVQITNAPFSSTYADGSQFFVYGIKR